MGLTIDTGTSGDASLDGWLTYLSSKVAYQEVTMASMSVAPTAQRQTLRQAQRQAHGRALSRDLGALRFVTLALVLIDAATTWAGRFSGAPSWGSFSAWTTPLLAVTVIGAAAALWRRWLFALPAAAHIASLNVTGLFGGGEVAFMIVAGVMIGATARPALVALAWVCYLGYAVAFAVTSEQRVRDGQSLYNFIVYAITGTVSLGAGLGARRALRARDERRERVLELERQRLTIRPTELMGLADELQALVSAGIRDLDAQVADARRQNSVASLSERLEAIEDSSRGVLAETRELLNLLRASAQSRPDRPPLQRWRSRARLVAASLLAAGAVIVMLPPADPGELVSRLGFALLLFALTAALFHTGLAAALAAGSLVAFIATDPEGLFCAFPAALLGFLALSRPSRLVTAVAVGGGLAAAAVLVNQPTGTAVFAGAGIFAALGAVLGIAVRHFRTERALSAQQLAALTEEFAAIRWRERSAVARELHDVVAHQLSLIAVYNMATDGSENATELRATLDRIDLAVQAADQELTTLVEALRGPWESTSSGPLVAPNAAADDLAQQLRADGFQPVMRLDPAADELDATTQRTLARILQEATTNILRYAAPGSACLYSLTLSEDFIHLQISSALPGDRRKPSDLSLGWGLRGIAERVDLTGGRFHAGPDRDQWVLDAALPRHQPDPSSPDVQRAAEGAR